MVRKSISYPPLGKAGSPRTEESALVSPVMQGDKSWPKISIVTPSYNQGQFLEETIRSVLEQGYPNLEYIIIDGGSSDNSVEIIKKYEKHLAYWVSEHDRGQSHAINKGFVHATGTLLGWLNSDDRLMPAALQMVAGMYMSHPDAGAFVGAGEFVDRRDKVLLRKEPQEVTLSSLYDWLDLFHFMQPSCFFTCAAWQDAGGLDESIHTAMDLDLWLKIARKFRFERTNALLSRSIVHGKAKTTEYRYLADIDAAFVIMRHGGQDQARRQIEKIAAKLALYDRWLSPVTGTALFRAILPYLKRLIGFEKKLQAMYPRWLSK